MPDRAADTVLPRGELLKEIEELRRENQQLRIQQQQADATARENDQLRALVGWQRQTPWKLKLASVVLREPANWWRTVQIDLGSRDGVRVNLPVLTTDGLVGRVSSVSLHAVAGGSAGRPGLQGLRAGRKSDARHRHHRPPAGRWTRSLVESGLSFRQRQS